MFEKLAAYLASQLDINEEDITEETTFFFKQKTAYQIMM